MLVHSPSTTLQPRYLGSADATNCVIVLLWAKGADANIAGACHIDTPQRAESLTAALILPAQELWKRKNPSTELNPVWHVSLVGAFDASEDIDTVNSILGILAESPHEFDLKHANVLHNNCSLVSDSGAIDISAELCCHHDGGDGCKGCSCEHVGNSTVECGARCTEPLEGGLPLTVPKILHAAVDAADGTVFVADFSYLGPDVELRSARVSWTLCVHHDLVLHLTTSVYGAVYT